MDDGVAVFASALVDAEPDYADVRRTMELVQLEAFEEEVFGEVSFLLLAPPGCLADLILDPERGEQDDRGCD